MDRSRTAKKPESAKVALVAAGLTYPTQEYILINERNKKKNKKNKKTKNKLQVNDASPTYASSIFEPDAPSANISTNKHASKLTDTQEHLFGAWREDIDYTSQNAKRVAERWSLNNTHTDLFGASESPKPKQAKVDTFDKLFGAAKPASPRHPRRWESDSHMTLFCHGSTPDVRAVNLRQVENTKDKIFPVGYHGAKDESHPWRRRSKSRPAPVRQDTHYSVFSLTRDPDVPLARRSSSPASDVKHEEFCQDKMHRLQQYHKMQYHQLPNPRSSLQSCPTTHDKLFGNQLSSTTAAEVLPAGSTSSKKPKFLPIKLNRVESQKTYEHLFPSNENVTSTDSVEVRRTHDSSFFPIHLRRVESPKTCIYESPDVQLKESQADPVKEVLADLVESNPLSERHTPRNPKVISDTVGALFYLPSSPEDLNSLREETAKRSETGQLPHLKNSKQRRIVQFGALSAFDDDANVYIQDPPTITRRHTISSSSISPITGLLTAGCTSQNNGQQRQQLDDDQNQTGAVIRRPLRKQRVQSGIRVNTITGRIMSSHSDVESTDDADDDDEEEEDDDDDGDNEKKSAMATGTDGRPAITTTGQKT